MTADTVLDRLLSHGVMPIVRIDSIDPLINLACAFAAGGLPIIEITLTTPNALAGLTRLIDEFGDTMLVGVGTVLDVKSCLDAISAGAQFIVSPHFDPAIISATKDRGKVSVPGGFTPTEIFRAVSAGADLVKIFPASGHGPNFIREVLAPMPNLRLMPTTGVTILNVGEWFDAGAVCVGAGSALFSKEMVVRGEWDQIRMNTEAFANAVAIARKPIHLS